jgi:hypothetical protein
MEMMSTAAPSHSIKIMHAKIRVYHAYFTITSKGLGKGSSAGRASSR